MSSTYIGSQPSCNPKCKNPASELSKKYVVISFYAVIEAVDADTLRSIGSKHSGTAENNSNNGNINDNIRDTEYRGPNNNTVNNYTNISRNGKSSGMGNNCRNVNPDVGNSNVKDDVNAGEVCGASLANVIR